MSEAIVIALIGMIGTTLAAVISAWAVVTAARGKAGAAPQAPAARLKYVTDCLDRVDAPAAGDAAAAVSTGRLTWRLAKNLFLAAWLSAASVPGYWEVYTPAHLLLGVLALIPIWFFLQNLFRLVFRLVRGVFAPRFG